MFFSKRFLSLLFSFRECEFVSLGTLFQIEIATLRLGEKVKNKGENFQKFQYILSKDVDFELQ